MSRQDAAPYDSAALRSGVASNVLHDREASQNFSEFLTIEQYCALEVELAGRCRASAFNDMRRVRRLAVKIGPHTRIVRDVILEEMERAQTPGFRRRTASALR